MIERSFTIENERGLGAREAVMLANTASSFSCEIMISAGKMTGNAKSLLSILMLGVKCGEAISIKIIGADELQASIAISQLLANGFSE